MREARRLGREGFQISVNVAPRTLLDNSFPETVNTVVHGEGRGSGTRLCIELTERTVATPGPVIERLESLISLGDIGIGIDDFGTGYSSLAYLSGYPIDHLKIDKSFVQGIGREQRKEAIVNTIIELAHNLGLAAVAEGVETARQRDFLVARRCDFIQGYFVARPMPFIDFRQWLAAYSPGGEPWDPLPENTAGREIDP